MNKKEQKEMDSLKHELALARALSWPSYPKPQPHAYIGTGGLMVGWYQTNWGLDHRVEQGCSNGMSHSRYKATQTDSQGAGVFYLTKAEALQVVRHEMTLRFAEILARIDSDIEEAS